MKLRSRRTRFFLYFSFFSLLAIIFFISTFSSSITASRLLTNPLLFYSIIDLFLMELFVLLLAGFILANGNVLSRSILYLLSTIFILIYFMQMASLHVGREFLSRLALENADHLYLFLDLRYLLFFFAIAATCLQLIYLTERGNRTPGSCSRLVTLPLLIIGILVTLTSGYWLPTSVINTRDRYLANINTAHTSPVISLYTTLFRPDISYSEPVLHRKLKPYEMEEISKFGFHYDPTAKYPLIKESIYASAPPFSVKPGKEGKTPNVIIFFSEGLSARSIGVYRSIYPDLTPHIDEFARTGMVVHRYYNHTAATYRGLHGQLASIFPFYGGHGGWHSDDPQASGRSYLSLADLFTDAGYETIFLDSHHRNHPSQVDKMMTELGFTTVITGDQLADTFLNGDPPKGDRAYSDHQYLQGVTGYLKRRVGRGETQPFFLSLYNFGTHAFLKSSEGRVVYGRGRNHTLNSIHNLDHAFGLFWEYLKDSPLADNTILVFTADHCHFHERSFVKSFKSGDYQQLFIDRIPLIIHDPLRRLPPSYDAENSSSIDFTPTIAHYLGLKNGPNPFMGNSIFALESKPYRNMSVAALGPQEIFLIDNDKIHTLNNSPTHTSTLEVLATYIELVRQLELDNLIWKEDQEVKD